MVFRRRWLLTHFVLAAVSLFTATIAPAQAVRSASEYPDSRVDLYGGYGYFHPVNSGIGGHQFMDLSNPNVTLSATVWFNRFVGVQAEGGYFSGNGEHRLYDPACSRSECDQLIYTAQAGPALRMPIGPFVPFIHALGGGVRTNGPVTQPLTWGWGVTGGIGFDYTLPILSKRLTVRPLQADFQYSQTVYGPLVIPAATQGGFGEIDALKLSSGLVLRIGDAQGQRPVQLGCAAEPTLVYPGDPVSVVGGAVNLNPRRTPEYTWETSGGKLTPASPTRDHIASIDTGGLAPGDYTVIGHIAEGLHARQRASCTAVFSVKAYEPPTLTCAANPAKVTSGTVVDIVTEGRSPGNRLLTYSYESSAGQITSGGPTAKLSTAGLGTSTVMITCHVHDDLGQAVTAMTQVAVTKPPLPVVVATQGLCTLDFARDRRRPVRVNNEAKGCLDDIALTLTQQTDARLVMIGNASPEEKPEIAAERALNARQYLTDEKGIAPQRIEVRLGETSGRTVRDVLVPAGAIFDQPNTQRFDESVVPRHGQPYGKRRLTRRVRTAP